MTQDHITGFAIGVAATALALYAYKKNQVTIDEFLRKNGINVPASAPRDLTRLTLEDLVAEKERLEDLIAEREYAVTAPAAAAVTGA
jgi:hypothetical protein